MTNRAHLFLNRRVLRLGFLYLFDPVGMTLAADSEHVPPEKFLFRRNVGIVAIQAAFLVQQRPMDPVLAEESINGGSVTSHAEFVAFLLPLQGSGRPGSLVALVAHSLRKRLMRNGIEKRFRAGTVRVVTGKAVRLAHRIIKVFLLEGIPFNLVAGGTKSGYALFQQVF
jgi:hypothetical protein